MTVRPEAPSPEQAEQWPMVYSRFKQHVFACEGREMFHKGPRTLMRVSSRVESCGQAWCSQSGGGPQRLRVRFRSGREGPLAQKVAGAWQGWKKEKSPRGSELSLVGSLGQGPALTLGSAPARYPSRDSGWSFPQTEVYPPPPGSTDSGSRRHSPLPPSKPHKHQGGSAKKPRRPK